MFANRSRHRARASAIAAGCLGVCALLIAMLDGCAARAPSTKQGRCTLATGMDTDRLADCGCIPASGPDRGSVMLMSEAAPANSRTVNIINYLCPRGSAGMVRVAVQNGVAIGIQR